MVCAALWPLSSSAPPLPPGEVHLWSASLLCSKLMLSEYEHLLDEREMARANRYALEISRTRFICARAILKTLLAMYTEQDLQSIRFRLGSLGKPYLPSGDGPELKFNSTDTADEALIAICRDAEIGVDIEYKSRQVNHAIIAKRKFTTEEYKQYLTCSQRQRREFFLSMWTRKEAYGKAIGVGIKYRLNEINLTDDDRSPSVAVCDTAGVEWEINQIEPTSELIACVVTEGKGWRFRCQRLFPHGEVPVIST